MLKDEGLILVRCKVADFMNEQKLVSKQPGPHKYKVANAERLDIPNTLDRKFDVDARNSAWCEDITFI
jgi:putative transposase